MEEAKATTPGFGAVGDLSGLLYTEHPDAGISLVLASAQPQERKEGIARSSGRSVSNAFHLFSFPTDFQGLKLWC